MDNEYNILWIDDEHDDEALLPFILQAEQQDIILDGYGSFREGFNALEANINFYDVILLDALFFEDEKSETPNPAGLGSAIQKIYELRNKKSFPYFILSGQTHFTEVTNPILDAFKLRCYNKKKSEDVIELLQTIKAEADTQIDLQIKHENQPLFNALKEYPDTARDTFISIFKGLKGLNNQFEDQLYFTQLRIILETLFRKANDYGILHDKCVKTIGNKINLTESCSFLSGYDTKHLNVKCLITHFPKVIATNVQNLIYTTGAASHTSEVDITQNIDIQAYRQNINTPYLLYSLALQLMDVLIWFDGYSNVNSDVEVNQSKWQIIKTNYTVSDENWIFGTVIRIAENGYGTFKDEANSITISITPPMVKEYKLKVDQKIEVITKPNQDGSKTFIKQIKSL
jgi:hypothetical protein